ALRDPAALAPPDVRSPGELVHEAVGLGARLLVSPYNAPLITAEWGVAVFREARAAGLATAFVSNGNGTPEVIDYLHPWIDLYKIDLKGFDDRHYRELGGRLQPILDTIQRVHAAGIWLEIVTLLIPGFNDDAAELRDLTRFIAGVSSEIPWHVTAFHRDYKMTGPADTTPDMLRRAAAIGRQAGLHFVYAGNQPGRVGDLEHTACPHCGIRLIAREGYRVLEYALTDRGRCTGCDARIPGRWDAVVNRQIATRPFLPHSRRLRMLP
ncbi:MAG: AmmeMemoRadiSam system radical SAM enzyme, partial [Candidatus Neomarinimicrobiota bacterium]